MAIITQIVCVSGEEELQGVGSAVISLVCINAKCFQKR